jgi:hypothetical protein
VTGKYRVFNVQDIHTATTVTITSVSLNINLLRELHVLVEKGNEKSTAERFITKSLVNIPLTNTECHVTHTGIGNEKQTNTFKKNRIFTCDW